MFGGKLKDVLAEEKDCNAKEEEEEEEEEVRSLRSITSPFRSLNLEHAKPKKRSNGLGFTAMEASLRQTIAPEGGHVTRFPASRKLMSAKEDEKLLKNRKKSSSGFPLQWKDAKKLEFVQEVEKQYRKNELATKIQSQFPHSYRWCVRMTPEADGVKFIAIEGDVSSVYPDLSAKILNLEAGAFGRYFSPEANADMTYFVKRAMAGDDQTGEVVTWHSLPEYDFIVQLEVHKSVTYYEEYEDDGMNKKKLIVIQAGETRIITESMRNFAQIIRNIIAEQRETVDHRFGNKIRLMHLLCQENRTKDLEIHFQRLRYEIEIRRKLFGNLPPIEPISPEAFFTSEFPPNFHISIDAPPRTDLLFYAKDTSPKIPISPIILQVLILQDCASNALKHGTGSVHFQVTPHAFLVSNEIHRDENPETSRHIGLSALKTAAQDLGLDIDFNKTSTHFTVTLYLTIEFLPQTTLDLVPNNNISNIDINEFAIKVQALQWLMIDDDELLCTKFKGLAKKQFNVNVHTIHAPADVANATKIVYALSRSHRDNAPPKPLVLIIDENLLEIDDDLNFVFISGTQIRDRLYSKARIKLLIKTNRIFFFSASASLVHDNRVSLALGKAGTVSNDIHKIVNFLHDNNFIFPQASACEQTNTLTASSSTGSGFSEEDIDQDKKTD